MGTEYVSAPCCCCDWPVSVQTAVLAQRRLPMVTCLRCWDLYDFLVLRKFFVLSLAINQLQGVDARLRVLEYGPQ